MTHLKSHSRTSEPTLRTLFDQYIYECRHTRRLRPETLRGYDAVFSTFLKLCPTVVLGTLTPQVIAQFHEVLQTRQRIVGRDTIKQGVKDSTVGTYNSKLHSFFKWLVDRGHLKQNPLAGVKRAYPAPDEIMLLRREEVEKIRTAVELNSKNLLQWKRDKMILSILLFCGVRREELVGLHVTDADLQRKQLTVRGQTSKSKKTRLMPINQTLQMHIEDYLEERKRQTKYTTPSLIVSLTRDRGLSLDGLKHWVDNYKRLSGVDFHAHRFRHTFACNLYMQTRDVLAVHRMLGHTSMRMTMVYLRSFDVQDFRSGVESMTFDSLM